MQSHRPFFSLPSQRGQKLGCTDGPEPDDNKARHYCQYDNLNSAETTHTSSNALVTWDAQQYGQGIRVMKSSEYARAADIAAAPAAAATRSPNCHGECAIQVPPASNG